MDQGPFRMPRPADKSEDDRPERRHSEEQKATPPAKEEVRKVHSSHRPYKEERSKKPFIIAAVVAVIVIALLVGVWSFVRNANSGGIDSGKYQAVFFTNGQVYFGKLSIMNDNYLKLTNIYYLQAKQTDKTDMQKLQKSTDDANLNNITLVKLGDEIHGPQDDMIINRDQVLFYENLKDDGKVASAIKQDKNSK